MVGQSDGHHILKDRSEAAVSAKGHTTWGYHEDGDMKRCDKVYAGESAPKLHKNKLQSGVDPGRFIIRHFNVPRIAKPLLEGPK